MKDAYEALVRAHNIFHQGYMTGLFLHRNKYAGRKVVWLVPTLILSIETARIYTMDMEMRCTVGDRD